MDLVVLGVRFGSFADKQDASRKVTFCKVQVASPHRATDNGARGYTATEVTGDPGVENGFSKPGVYRCQLVPGNAGAFRIAGLELVTPIALGGGK